MRIKNDRIVPNTKGSGITTIVKGIRAESEFWEKCEKIAEKEQTNRNELIVRVVSKYCDKKGKKS